MKYFFHTLFWGVVACFVLSKLGQYFWLADVFSHAQLQYLVICLICMLVFVIMQHWRIAFFSLCFVMALAYPFIDTNSLLIDEVDIYFLNAQYTNPDLHAVMGELVNMQPGLVSIVELPEGMGEMMLDAGYEPVYEYIDKELSMGLYKQIGIKGVTGEVIDNGIYPIGKAQTPFGVLYTIHPFPPLKMSLWHDQVEHFERVTQMIKQ